MDLDQLLQQVMDLTKEAARLTEQDFVTTEKESHINFVTSADIAVQNFLREKLVALLPGSAFFGEEGDEAVKAAEYLWVVDPIDGTVNFSRGMDAWAISVGLVRGSQVLLGVIYAPRKNEVYYARLGGGAYLNGTPIHTSRRPFSHSLFCTALSLYRKEYTEPCLHIMREVYTQSVDIRRVGSCALDICYLAKGECDLFFEFRVFPWDYAAGVAILQEAGGIITGLDGGPLTFDRTSPLIAANHTENHQKLLEIVHKHIPAQPYEEVLV